MRVYLKSPDRCFIIVSPLSLFMFSVFCFTNLSSVMAASETLQVLSHNLNVTLDPPRHHLRATDRMVLRRLQAGLRQASFTLHADLHINQIAEIYGDSSRSLSFRTKYDSGKHPSAPTQEVTVFIEATSGQDQGLTLQWTYEGSINDPPREPRHLRFVTPSETAGHIGPEGAYLSGETHWYPDLADSLSTYRVRVQTPREWQAVSHGALISESHGNEYGIVEWQVNDKTEALTVVANQFVTRHRQWNNLAIVTYLFPEDAPLADEYLDAAAHYLEVYVKLLGPYPFPKFAVVENFFASGLGMPSFTLLGSGVIKRRYVQPFALGHEIVHSWIGNWVFNKADSGNWVEGLTTYLANYYFEELTSTPEHARAQRRMMLLGYSIYVPPGEDYSVGEFRHKTDQKDNAIGYQKAAMIFHMLRRQIGDELFWHALRTLVTRFGGRHAAWDDLERIFSDAAGEDLRWFFSQWVDHRGAPILSVFDGRVVSVATHADTLFQINARVTQNERPFRVRVPVRITLQNSQAVSVELDLRSLDQTVTISVSTRPVSLEVDPDYHVFRRLDRTTLPPMLNLFLTDGSRLVIEPVDPDPASHPYAALARRIKGQDAGHGSVTIMTDRSISGLAETGFVNGSVLVLGDRAMNRFTDWAVGVCGNVAQLGMNKTVIEGRVYEGPEIAVLLSCRDPQTPDHVVSVFYGHTPHAVTRIARVLFFYGWQSYVVFQEGAVISRGDFVPERDDLMVRFP